MGLSRKAYFGKKRTAEESRIERLRKERDALLAALQDSYRVADLSIPVDFVAFTPANWRDFHESPSCGLVKWTEQETDALISRVRAAHFTKPDDALIATKHDVDGADIPSPADRLRSEYDQPEGTS